MASSEDSNDHLIKSTDPQHPANLIPELCKKFWTLGWVTGTGGGASIRNDDLVYLAPSGVQKELMKPEDIYVLELSKQLDPKKRIYLRSPPAFKPSQCTPLFIAAFTKCGAGCCIHTHSQWAVLVTLLLENSQSSNKTEFEINNIEQIKGFGRGFQKQGNLGYHDTLRIPVIENTPHEEDLTQSLSAAMDQYPDTLRHSVKATAAKPSSKTSPSPKPRPYLNFPPSSLSYHWDTLPPTSEQLAHATKFFQVQPPEFLWSAPKFHSMSFGDSPEVCFLGRSNVGKSSLLNVILGRQMAHTSSKRGRTKMMNAFSVGGPSNHGKNRLVVLDMPGYGKGGRAEWGEEVLKYLGKRKQLTRAFLLVDAEHGVKESDLQLLSLFKQEEIPYQAILSKVDKILFPGSRLPSEGALEARFSDLRRTMEKVKEAVQPNTEDDGGAVGEVIACSSEKFEGKRLGIDAVRFAMLQAAGLEYRPKVELAIPQEIVPYEKIFGTL
ncbi:Methylthioribulose-1-phosphate deHydratase [Hyphodiscus hymeniophilus]|uniref:Methylthioribulose-1-phosphate deHydratase n=1 Tax=Hyphodiscus hymeniophilus TaxID=353542 RepID=A0A9P6SJW7_9HELO|nr:Methylthioribulose-1-phosphate deHydratase [Hyphodiscus hymeniophilus]